MLGEVYLLNDKNFAERIAELRRDKMLSQKELGDMLGVSNKAVSKWERGEAMPQMKTIVKIAEIFGISPDELLTGTKYDNSQRANAVPDAKLDVLKNENQRLRSDLAGANKKNKKARGISIVVCIALAVTALIIVLYNLPQNENINNGVKSLGNDGTVIEFCKQRFVPANEFEENYFKNNFLGFGDNEKYAQFFDENGNESKILILPVYSGAFVCAYQKDKPFVYVNEKKRVELKKENIDLIYLNDDVNMIYQTISSEKGVDYFLKYYDAKKEPENAAAITKAYYNNRSRTVEVQFKDYTRAEIGNLFMDNDGNLYFYDYLTAKAYEMGGELFEYTEDFY